MSISRQIRRFLSTPSARRATAQRDADGRRESNFYPRPPRGGRLDAVGVGGLGQLISIHALREEGDRHPLCGFLRRGISIHALREEGDGVCDYLTAEDMKFLSTPSARRATAAAVASGKSLQFLSTPSARRATVVPLNGCRDGVDFYPRPPRGGRLVLVSLWGTVAKFLSTPSARRATIVAGDGSEYLRISIHALREEGDNEARQIGVASYLFLSTPSARRATSRASGSCARASNFYPRPPRGGRRSRRCRCCRSRPISIHALREEGDPLDFAVVSWL